MVVNICLSLILYFNLSMYLWSPGQGGQLDQLHHRAVLADVEEGDLALVLPLVRREDRVDRQLGLLCDQE